VNYVATWTLNRGFPSQRLANSAHASLVPAQVFQTQDGYLVVLCFKEKFWRALTRVLDAPELATDPRYASFASRYQHRDALISDLKGRFLVRTTEEWLARMSGRVPCAPVNSVEEALREEQVLARDMLVEIEHPHFGTLRQVRTAVKVQDAAEHLKPAPALGADTEAVLRTILGYADEEISLLHRLGAI
jgi:crotonobetainyl-CoA:carnitine CoA-transferase CaiB-like acyl-CoA transferase